MRYEEKIEQLPKYCENDGMYALHIPELKAVFECFTGYTTDEQIKNIKNKYFELIKSGDITTLISDMRNFKGATPEMIEWVDDWLLRINKEGIVNIAMIFPTDVFAEFTLENVLGTVYKLTKAQKFKSLDEAAIWIKNLEIDA